jgi:hypothetical protein
MWRRSAERSRPGGSAGGQGVAGGPSTSTTTRARGLAATKIRESSVSIPDNEPDGKRTAADFDRAAAESFARLARLETVEQMRARVFAGPRRLPDDPFLVNG